MNIFYNTVQIKRKCVSDNVTKERRPLVLNLLYMCPGTPKNKGSSQALRYCMYNIKMKFGVR
jgi:hypothetical protein